VKAELLALLKGLRIPTENSISKLIVHMHSKIVADVVRRPARRIKFIISLFSNVNSFLLEPVGKPSLSTVSGNQTRSLTFGLT